MEASRAGEVQGIEYAMQQEVSTEVPRPTVKNEMQRRFASFMEPYRPILRHFEWIRAMAESFRDGFVQSRFPQASDVVLVPTTKRVDVVLSACNEERSIGAVLQQLQQLSLNDLFVIINGSKDGTLQIAKEQAQEATIVHYTDPLGHDIGRSIGARLSDADIVLFMDGDFPVPADKLAPFIWAIETGVDVALNNITPLLHHFGQQDGITHCKQWLNRCLGREDLYANSMTAVPHALSRHAIETVGEEALCVPPKAQALAIVRGLHVQAVQVVDVIHNNRIRQTNVGASNPVATLILGDHMEAFQALMMERDTVQTDNVERERIARGRNVG